MTIKTPVVKAIYPIIIINNNITTLVLEQSRKENLSDQTNKKTTHATLQRENVLTDKAVHTHL